MDSVEVVQAALEDMVGNVQPFNLAVRSVGALRERDRESIVALYKRPHPWHNEDTLWVEGWNDALNAACDALGLVRPD